MEKDVLSCDWTWEVGSLMIVFVLSASIFSLCDISETIKWMPLKINKVFRFIFKFIHNVKKWKGIYLKFLWKIKGWGLIWKFHKKFEKKKCLRVYTKFMENIKSDQCLRCF